MQKHKASKPPHQHVRKTTISNTKQGDRGVHACTNTRTGAHTHIHTRAHTYTHTHAHTCTPEELAGQLIPTERYRPVFAGPRPLTMLFYLISLYCILFPYRASCQESLQEPDQEWKDFCRTLFETMARLGNFEKDAAWRASYGALPCMVVLGAPFLFQPC